MDSTSEGMFLVTICQYSLGFRYHIQFNYFPGEKAHARHPMPQICFAVLKQRGEFIPVWVALLDCSLRSRYVLVAGLDSHTCCAGTVNIPKALPEGMRVALQLCQFSSLVHAVPLPTQCIRHDTSHTG